MQAFEYKYRVSGIHKTPAQVAGEVCEELSHSELGLTPQTLVDFSRPVESPTHQEFEWDDSLAAEEYRKTQAAKLIRNIVAVKIEETTSERVISIIEEQRSSERSADNRVTQRCFVSTGERDHNYVTIEDAMENSVWRANLLEAAKRDMKAFVSKYRMLKELSNIIVEMDELLSA